MSNRAKKLNLVGRILFGSVLIFCSNNLIAASSGLTNPADLNNDEKVNFLDYSILANGEINFSTLKSFCDEWLWDKDRPFGKIRAIPEFEQSGKVLIGGDSYLGSDPNYFGIYMPYDLIDSMRTVVEVVIIVKNQEIKTNITSQLAEKGIDSTNISFFVTDANENSEYIYTRNFGGLFISNASQIKIVDAGYMSSRPSADSIPSLYGSRLGIPVYNFNMLLEGGNYMSDGFNIGITTEKVLRDNPGLTQTEIAQNLQDYLGSTEHIMQDSPYGNTFCGFVDHTNIWAKFLAPDKIMIEEVPEDYSIYGVEWNIHDRLEELADYWQNQESAYGTKFKVYRVYSPNGEPYINSLILNDHVFVPFINGSQWNDDAIASYEAAMPGYIVNGYDEAGIVGFGHPPIDPLSSGTGWLTGNALNCRTLQIPDTNMIEIIHLRHPDTNDTINDYLIGANITAYSGAGLNGNPKIYWRTQDQAWENNPPVNMNFESGNLYSAAIPHQPEGTNISYYIYAEDNSGRSKQDPYIGQSDPHTFKIIPQ